MCRPRALVATACRLQIAAPSPSPLLRVALVDDVAFYDAATKVYRRRTHRLGFDLAERVEVYRKARAKNLTELQAAEPHPWRHFYA